LEYPPPPVDPRRPPPRPRPPGPWGPPCPTGELPGRGPGVGGQLRRRLRGVQGPGPRRIDPPPRPATTRGRGGGRSSPPQVGTGPAAWNGPPGENHADRSTVLQRYYVGKTAVGIPTGTAMQYRTLPPTQDPGRSSLRTAWGGLWVAFYPFLFPSYFVYAIPKVATSVHTATAPVWGCAPDAHPRWEEQLLINDPRRNATDHDTWASM